MLYVYFLGPPENEELQQQWTTACGASQPLTITDGMEYITSLNYPYKYFNNLDCTWVIPPEAGKYVDLTFVDFEVEYE